MQKSVKGLSKRIASFVIVATMLVTQAFASTTQWSQFRGDLNGVTSAKTPFSTQTAAEKWVYKLKESTDWETNISDPLIVNSNVYIAVGNKLIIINRNGVKTGECELSASIDYTCRMVYANGNIIVPLAKGLLQAVNAITLETIWTSSEIITYDAENNPQIRQSLNTIAVCDDKVYTADWMYGGRGVINCVNINNGSSVWHYDNKTAGYYWSGFAFFGNAVVTVGEDGILTSFNKDTGSVIDELNIGCVKSTVVKNGSDVVIMASDGNLHKIAVNNDGSFGVKRSVKVADSSTSTPTIYGGKIYVGGSQGSANNFKGVIAFVDYDTMNVIAKADTIANVQSSIIVSNGFKNKAYAYFTCNKNPGSLYCFDGNAVSEIYTPSEENQNYCMATPVVDSEGTVYYTNDSGKLFAVKAQNLPVENDKDKIVAVTSVKLNKKAVNLKIGGKYTLKATISPDNATDNAVKWTTSNKKIVTVKNGKITAKGVGKAVVKATVGAKVATVTVTVKPKAPTKFNVSKKNNKITVKFKKGTGSSKTQIEIKCGKKVIKKTTSNLIYKKTLKKGKYKVRVRAFKKVSGKTYYSSFTKYKTIRIK